MFSLNNFRDSKTVQQLKKFSRANLFAAKKEVKRLRAETCFSDDQKKKELMSTSINFS